MINFVSQHSRPRGTVAPGSSYLTIGCHRSQNPLQLPTHPGACLTEMKNYKQLKLPPPSSLCSTLTLPLDQLYNRAGPPLAKALHHFPQFSHNFWYSEKSYVSIDACPRPMCECNGSPCPKASFSLYLG